MTPDPDQRGAVRKLFRVPRLPPPHIVPSPPLPAAPQPRLHPLPPFHHHLPHTMGLESHRCHRPPPTPPLPHPCSTSSVGVGSAASCSVSFSHPSEVIPSVISPLPSTSSSLHSRGDQVHLLPSPAYRPCTIWPLPVLFQPYWPPGLPHLSTLVLPPSCLCTRRSFCLECFSPKSPVTKPLLALQACVEGHLLREALPDHPI